MALSSRIAAVALGASACVHPQPVIDRETVDAGVQQVATASEESKVREQTLKFVDASERKDFAAVYAMLGGPLRARYTPQRLAQDFAAEPLSGERVARVKAALAAPFSVSGSTAELPLGDGRAFRLGKEDGQWKVVALE